MEYLTVPREVFDLLEEALFRADEHLRAEDTLEASRQAGTMKKGWGVLEEVEYSPLTLIVQKARKELSGLRYGMEEFLRAKYRAEKPVEEE